jgi:hypothetical protein
MLELLGQGEREPRGRSPSRSMTLWFKSFQPFKQFKSFSTAGIDRWPVGSHGSNFCSL